MGAALRRGRHPPRRAQPKGRGRPRRCADAPAGPGAPDVGYHPGDPWALPQGPAPLAKGDPSGFQRWDMDGIPLREKDGAPWPAVSDGIAPGAEVWTDAGLPQGSHTWGPSRPRLPPRPPPLQRSGEPLVAAAASGTVDLQGRGLRAGASWGRKEDPLRHCSSWSDKQCADHLAVVAGKWRTSRRPPYAEMASASGDVWEALASMRTRGAPLGVLSYNFVLGLFARWRRREWVDKVEKLMRDDKVAPDVGTYVALLNAASRYHDNAAVWQRLQELLASGIAPDIGVWTVVAAAAARTGDFQGARAAVHACERGCGRSVVNTALMNAVLSAAHGHAAVQRLTDEMDARGVPRDLVTFCAGMKAATRPYAEAIAAATAAAEAAAAAAEDPHGPVPVQSPSAVAAKVRQMVWQFIYASRDAGYPEASEALSAAAAALRAAGDHTGVVQLARHAARVGWEDEDASLSSTALRSCAALALRPGDAHVSFAEALFRRCEMLNSSGAQTLWAQMMKVYAAVGDGHGALRLRKRMRERHLRESQFFMQHLREALRRAGMHPPEPQGEAWRRYSPLKTA